MIAAVASCTIGTSPCDDVGMGTAAVLPWWCVALIVLGAAALAAAVVALLLHASRRRPWG